MGYINSTQQYQRKLVAYTRSGVEEHIPGTKQEGISRYRDMIYNIVNDSLGKAYPLTKKIFSVDEWNFAVKEYFSNHACQSPFLWRMPFEFYTYIKDHAEALDDKYPFLADLLLYEWIEIEVFMMEDTDIEYRSDGQLENSRLVLNPACVIQYFQYPVYNKELQKITRANKGHYFLLTYRNPLTGEVSFLEIAPMFARMIELLAQEPMSIDDLIKYFSEETSLVIDSDTKTQIIDFYRKCFDKRIILGYN